jgi:transposase
MHVEPHDAPERLAELARGEPRGKVARRLLAVRLALLGQTAREIAEQVLLSDRQVRTWVARYNAGGLDALVDRDGRGRDGPLDPDQEARFADRIRAGATAADGVCTLRGEDARRILRDEFGVVRSLSAVYALLHGLGLEPLRPRPRHPEADTEAQEAFRKNSPSGSPPSPPSGPPSTSRSGSRTRRDSARRGR